jgi:FimV-like protein
MLRELLSGRTGKPKELTDMVSISKSDIVGRDDDLKNLRNSLLKENVTALINGIGGIGKTTLAAVYISEFYDDYDHIAWLTLENTLEEAIAANSSLLTNLNLREVPPQEQLSACMNALRIIESEKPKLLILDNAHENLAEHYDSLPKAPGWHLLVTSRERISRFYIMDLDFLKEDEAIKLFEKHNDRFSEDQIRSIVKQVELHTLTIEILAKSFHKNRWDLDTVQHALKHDAKSGVRVPHHTEKIDRIKSYLTSIFDISDLSEHETYLLKQFTALPNQWIKYDFLSELLQRETLEWKEDFAGTLSDVCDNGYVLEDEKTDSFKMHPVLVEALAPHLSTTIEDVMLLVDSISELLRLDQAKDNPIDKFQFIPFGDAILKQIPDDTSAETSVLKNNLASAYEDLGDYDKARDLLEQALESALENFGDKHPSVAAIQSNLANVYRELGDYEKARYLLEQALASAKENFGDKHPDVAVTQSNLANAYKELGEYEKARDLLEQALESDLENFDDKHPSVAIRQSNLANVYSDLGEYERARDLLEKALASDLENFGDKHPNVAVRQSNLANVYRNLGDYDKARDLLEQALESALENFDDKHPKVAIRQSNLATVYSDLGEYEKARDLLEQALASDLENFGDKHPTVAVRQSNLALVYQALGDYDKARDLLEQALASDLENFDDKHPTVAVDQSNLALVYEELGDYDKARDLWMKAYDIFVTTLGEQHPHTKLVKGFLDAIEEK